MGSSSSRKVTGYGRRIYFHSNDFLPTVEEVFDGFVVKIPNFSNCKNSVSFIEFEGSLVIDFNVKKNSFKSIEFISIREVETTRKVVRINIPDGCVFSGCKVFDLVVLISFKYELRSVLQDDVYMKNYDTTNI